MDCRKIRLAFYFFIWWISRFWIYCSFHPFQVIFMDCQLLLIVLHTSYIKSPDTFYIAFKNTALFNWGKWHAILISISLHPRSGIFRHLTALWHSRKDTFFTSNIARISLFSKRVDVIVVCANKKVIGYFLIHMLSFAYPEKRKYEILNLQGEAAAQLSFVQLAESMILSMNGSMELLLFQFPSLGLSNCLTVFYFI